MLLRNSAHIKCLNEAEAFLDPQDQNMQGARKGIAIKSWSARPIACFVRGNKHARLELLARYISTRSQRQSTHSPSRTSIRNNWSLPYLSNITHRAARGGFQNGIMPLVTTFQCDASTGDANKSANTYSRMQWAFYPEIGLINHIMQTYQDTWNTTRRTPIEERMDYAMAT